MPRNPPRAAWPPPDLALPAPEYDRGMWYWLSGVLPDPSLDATQEAARRAADLPPPWFDAVRLLRRPCPPPTQALEYDTQTEALADLRRGWEALDESRRLACRAHLLAAALGHAL